MRKATPAEAKDLISKGVVKVNVVNLAAPLAGRENPDQRYNTSGYIKWFDTDNRFPQNLIERKRSSTTHSRILQDKVRLSIGDGVKFEGGNEKDLINKTSLINSKGECLNELLEKYYTDFADFGNLYIYIIRNGNAVALDHLDASCCRIKEAKDGGVNNTHIGYSRDWTKYTRDNFRPMDIPLYPNFEPVPNGKGAHSILHIKKYHPGYYYYGLIDYYAAYYSGWLDIDYQIPKYNLSRFHNQFRPTGMLVLTGTGATEKVVTDAVDDVTKNYTGEGNNSQLFVLTVDDPDAKPIFIPFDDAPEGAFNELQNIANENIILAHGWHPSLILNHPGKLSNSSDIEVAYDLVYSNVITPFKNYINRKVEYLLKNELKLVFDRMDTLRSSLVSLTTSLDPKAVLTIDEQRQVFGMEILPENKGTALLAVKGGQNVAG